METMDQKLSNNTVHAIREHQNTPIRRQSGISMLMLKKSHLNVLIVIYKFHETDIETTMVTHYILSQYGIKKVINIFGDNGVR